MKSLTAALAESIVIFVCVVVVVVVNGVGRPIVIWIDVIECEWDDGEFECWCACIYT
jgi:hypothetical protein